MEPSIDSPQPETEDPKLSLITPQKKLSGLQIRTTSPKKPRSRSTSPREPRSRSDSPTSTPSRTPQASPTRRPVDRRSKNDDKDLTATKEYVDKSKKNDDKDPKTRKPRGRPRGPPNSSINVIKADLTQDQFAHLLSNKAELAKLEPKRCYSEEKGDLVHVQLCLSDDQYTKLRSWGKACLGIETDVFRLLGDEPGHVPDQHSFEDDALYNAICNAKEKQGQEQSKQEEDICNRMSSEDVQDIKNRMNFEEIEEAPRQFEEQKQTPPQEDQFAGMQRVLPEENTVSKVDYHYFERMRNEQGPPGPRRELNPEDRAIQQDENAQREARAKADALRESKPEGPKKPATKGKENPDSAERRDKMDNELRREFGPILKKKPQDN